MGSVVCRPSVRLPVCPKIKLQVWLKLNEFAWVASLHDVQFGQTFQRGTFTHYTNASLLILHQPHLLMHCSIKQFWTGTTHPKISLHLHPSRLAQAEDGVMRRLTPTTRATQSPSDGRVPFRWLVRFPFVFCMTSKEEQGVIARTALNMFLRI